MLEKLTTSPTRSRTAYERLKEAILTLKLLPGQPLVETALGEQLGMSKTPIRDALVRLEREGLVQQSPFRGAVVSGISLADVDDLYQVRELLEPFAVRRATLQASADDLARLEAMLAESREMLASQQLARYYQINRCFHAFFVRQAENRLLSTIYDNINDRAYRLSLLTSFVQDSPERILQQHAEIVAAAVARDADAAGEAMLRHIRTFHEQLRTEVTGRLGWLIGAHADDLRPPLQATSS